LADIPAPEWLRGLSWWCHFLFGLWRVIIY